jgi:hypothetical protein
MFKAWFSDSDNQFVSRIAYAIIAIIVQVSTTFVKTASLHHRRARDGAAAPPAPI